MRHRIRPAVADDASAIASVHVSSWRTTYRGLLPDDLLANLSHEQREAMWRERLDVIGKDSTHRGVWIAEDELGDVIGFASGGPEREPETGFEGELYAIYLLREHQGHGVGRGLVDRVTGYLRARGFVSMRVWVLQGNPAQGFYERLGGQRVGERRITLGGASFVEVAYGWSNIDDLLVDG